MEENNEFDRTKNTVVLMKESSEDSERKRGPSAGFPEASQCTDLFLLSHSAVLLDL